MFHCQIVFSFTTIQNNKQQQSMTQLRSSQTILIKPLKPLLFDFFASSRPTGAQAIIEDNDIRYQSYLSQRLEYSQSFRPKLSCKKMIDEPKFYLSVEKKKIKVINGLSQRATLQKPSRNSYRGAKVRSNTNKTQQQQQSFQTNNSAHKYRRVQSQQLPPRPLAKSKTPHLPFNLRHLLQTCKAHPHEFNQKDHIKGSNYPYYNFYSSKSPISRKSSRKSQQSRRDQQRQRYFSTVDIKPFPL